MSVVLTVFIILASLLMIGIVLVQKSKGGGLASNFASSNQIMGVRKTTDFVEKATWTLAIVIMVLSIATVFVSHNGQQSSVSEIKDIVNTEAPAALPGFETPATGLPPPLVGAALAYPARSRFCQGHPCPGSWTPQAA